MKGVLIGLGALLLIVAIVLGGWQLNWWFAKENTNRQVKIDNRNIGTQTAWRDEVTQDIRDYNMLDDSHMAQKNAIKNQACDLIPRLVDSYKTNDIVEFESRYC